MDGSTVTAKAINEARVLRVLRKHSGISRIEIARELGLDRSTITNIIGRLQKTGIIKARKEGAAPAKGGRRPTPLILNPKFGCVLGVEIQLNVFRTVLTDLTGTVLDTRTRSLKKKFDLSETLERVLKGVQTAAAPAQTPLMGVGLALPGTIDPMTKTILHSNALGVKDYPFPSDNTPFPVLLDNDANCCAWGILNANDEERLENVLCLIMEHHKGSTNTPPDQDLGMGIVIGGQVYYGAQAAAGELPFSLVPTKTKAYQGIYAPGAEPMSHHYRAYFEEVFTRMLPIVGTLNPSHVFLGGEFSSQRGAAEEALKKHGGELAGAQIRFAQSGEYEVARGAASMFLERLFQIPSQGSANNRSDVSWESVLSATRSRGGKA
ncbi:MAG: ROK family transcriptional regulator [Planctomycetota bacterium]|jgi:predicted NBD/HSP70 family sugar kinase